MAQCFLNGERRGFWSEIKKIKGRKGTCPNSIDGVQGESSITEVFSEKYEYLYNSVPYDAQQMAELKSEINQNIKFHGECSSHFINVQDVLNMVCELKPGKHDGFKGHFTNHLINGTNRLYCHIALLFNSMVSHGFVPDDFLLSTIIPIPKKKRKSLNDSDNYRAIALSSVMGKLLVTILLCKC
jgi:hypothetical protein